MIQSSICMYPFFFRFFSHIGHYGALSRVPCALQQVLSSDSTWKVRKTPAPQTPAMREGPFLLSYNGSIYARRKGLEKEVPGGSGKEMKDQEEYRLARIKPCTWCFNQKVRRRREKGGVSSSARGEEGKSLWCQNWMDSLFSLLIRSSWSEQQFIYKQM